MGDTFARAKGPSIPSQVIWSTIKVSARIRFRRRFPRAQRLPDIIRVPNSSERRIYIKRYPCSTLSLFLQAPSQRVMLAGDRLAAQITRTKWRGTTIYNRTGPYCTSCTFSLLTLNFESLLFDFGLSLVHTIEDEPSMTKRSPVMIRRQLLPGLHNATWTRLKRLK